ncbi:MAG: DUF433 domain-containing protein [Burkholderiales bacterium]|nr:MAG: DUF433 domain-containing protein [Burkholderiales bacterium]
MEHLDRTTRRPDVMGGKACIRGMRVTFGMHVGHGGAGRSFEQLLADYPYLEREDILQALRYAAWLFVEVKSGPPGQPGALAKGGPLTQNTHTGVHT